MNGDILGDRQWWIALGAIVVSALLFALGRGSLPRAGQATTYAITVVPTDARALECASNAVMRDRRCGFNAQLQPLPERRPLRPFVTVGRELLLLSGVFESNSVAAWLEEARKNGDETRVTLQCYARILGIMPRVSVRWVANGDFQPEGSVMSADVEDCVVQR